jgi:biopolymer transport protein ExbD
VSVIDMNTPADSDDGSKSPENLALTVTIDDGHFVVEGRSIARTTIVRSDPNAKQQLAAALAGIAGRHPDNTDVVVISQPDTRYSDIVAVMDISRESGLPTVSLLGAE